MPHNPILASRTRGRRQHRVTGLRSALASALALILALALASSASALEQKIAFSGNDSLGFSVAVQGDTLVVGTCSPTTWASRTSTTAQVTAGSRQPR